MICYPRARVAVFLAAAILVGCQGGQTEAVEATETTSLARFVAPEDGATVPGTFTVEMAADGVTIEPAGEIRENAGHFHVIVDAPFVAAGQVIPTDDDHLHFGTGATSAELTLPPGEHTLRLQVANGAHIAFDAATHGHEIVVTVEGDD